MPVGLAVDGINFSTSTLDDMPEWAIVLAKIFTVFALSEGTVGGIYGLLKHQNHEQAVRDLKKMGTNKSRADAVRALANTVLSPADAAFVTAPIDDVLLHAQERNKVAHGIWGFHPDDKGRIYVIPVKKYVTFVASLVPNAHDPIPLVEELKGHMNSYTLAELSKIEADGSALLVNLMETYNLLGKRAALTMPGWEVTLK